MKWLRVFPVIMLILLSAVTVNADGGPVTKDYGDYTLPTGAGYQFETWNLNKGPVTITYTLDLGGAPNVAYTGNYGHGGQVGLIWWDGGPAVAGALMSGFLADWDNAGAEFPTYPDNDGTLDLDDKFNLQRFPNPGSWSETQYDVTFDPTTVYASPIGSYSNYGIWFDRDGVDEWQDDAWGAVNGGTYNTGGVYKVQLTFTKLNATTGVVEPLFFPELPNGDAPDGYGVPTGFNKLSGGGYQYFPAGISFQTDEIKMAAMRVLVQGNAGNGTIEIRDLEVTGYPSDTPVTTNVVADPNPVSINGSLEVSAIVESKTDVPVGFAEFSLNGGPWSLLGDAWLPNGGILEVSGTITAPATAGIYDLCVRGVDNYWNRGEPACTMLVVYDPSAGFVTGGGWIDSPPDAMGPTSVHYGDLTLDSPWWNTSFPESWNLAACDLSITFDLDMSQMGAGWVPIEVGLKEPGAPNLDPNGEGGWLLAIPHLAGSTNPDLLDDDDHFLLVDHGWQSDELDYDVYPDGSIAAPLGTYDTAGFWFDRDGVDQWQATYWDMSQNGTAYGTEGHYTLQIDYSYSADAAKGIMFATINDGHQGIYTSGWKNAEPEIFPVGKSFSVEDFDDLRMFVGAGNISGQAQVSNLTITGCPNIVGEANFGFVSKYKKGADVPTGNTEFVFEAGDLNFHSTSYDWLVVTGSNYARFKGTGTINGEGDYKFMLWAGDGTGSDGADTFRIKIWTEDEFGVETVVYDNGMDQAIGGGSIVVHDK